MPALTVIIAIISYSLLAGLCLLAVLLPTDQERE